MAGKTPKIAVVRGKKQPRVVVKARNNKTLAVTEPFSSKAKANEAAERLKKTVAKARIIKLKK